jgi:hypothetical protein
MRIWPTVGSAIIFVTAISAVQGMQQPYPPTMQPQQPYIPQGIPPQGMPYGQPMQPYGQQGILYGQPGPQMQPPMQPYPQNPQMMEQQQRMMFFRTYPMANEMDWNRYKQMNNIR